MIASARTSRHHSHRGLRLHEWPNGFRPVAILMIVLLLNSEFAFGSWLSAITGIDVNVPAGTISFSSPRPEAIPEMLKNFPVDVLEFAYNCLLTKGVCPGVWMATLVRQAKAQAQGSSQPMPDFIRSRLVNFFPAYILDKSRWVIADPSRSPLEGMIFGGNCPDVQIAGLHVSCSNGALSLDNVIVFQNADANHAGSYTLWAHELTHVSQYDGMGVDGFAFAYTLDPRALEDQAYAWENTVKNAPPNQQVVSRQYTMAPGGRVSLTTNNFTAAITRVSSDPAWRQSHTGFGRGGDCTNFRVGGTDTGVSIPDSDMHLKTGRDYEAAQNWPSAITEYREAVRLNFTNAVAFDRLGVALTKGGQPQEGVLQIKKAICMDKSKPGFRGDLAAAQLSNGDVNAAVIEYQIAIWFNQRNPKYHRDLAAALEKRGDREGAKAQYWATTLLKPGSSGARKPPPRPIAASPPLPVPAWLKPVTWSADTADKWHATVGGRGCRVDLTRQVLFEPRPDKPLLVYTEDTLLSSNASDFCIDHSDDPAVDKHINMRFRFTLEPKPDGTIAVNGTLEDPCSHCALPRPLATREISGVITRRTDREFWLTLRGAVHGGFQMRPAN